MSRRVRVNCGCVASENGDENAAARVCQVVFMRDGSVRAVREAVGVDVGVGPVDVQKTQATNAGPSAQERTAMAMTTAMDIAAQTRRRW